MRLYLAMVLGCIVAYLWPDRNVAEVPFSELTLKLIANTGIVLWLGYHAIKLAFESLEKDEFWPWRWTKNVVLMLALRTGWIAGYFAILWVAMTQTKFGPWLDESPIVVGVASFIMVTFAVCADDETIKGDDPSPPATKE